MRGVRSLSISTVALGAALFLLPPTAGAQPTFVRGDCNGDGAVNIGDPVFLLATLFSTGPTSNCPDACDANDDSGLDIADAIYALSFLFSGGSPPFPPHPACGVDPTADAILCPFYPLCQPVVEICNNGTDDDADGATDCLDSDCAGDPACAENCTNGVDDDADGATDCFDTDCAALPVCGGSLLLNEVDYDQPGTDTQEFIEIHNPGTGAVSLAGMSLVLVNGATSTEYASIDLSAVGSLPAGGYLVVHSLTTTIAPGALSHPFPAGQDNIQNGAPDAIALIDMANGLLIDALSYEGPVTAAQILGVPGTLNLVEGAPTAAADDNVTGGLVLIRSPNGANTGNDASDWTTSTPPTPGSANP